MKWWHQLAHAPALPSSRRQSEERSPVSRPCQRTYAIVSGGAVERVAGLIVFSLNVPPAQSTADRQSRDL
jgi:hypothetical protein